MMEGLVQYVGIAVDGDFPEDLDLGELETLLNDSFGIRGMELVQGYFKKGSPNYPSDVSFLVLTQDTGQEGNPYVGILLAETKEAEGIRFDYYDKIAVHPAYQGKGVMPELLKTARMVEDPDSEIQLALLRTSDSEISQKYSALSDKVVPIGNYYVHGFGFFDKETGNPLFEGAQEKFESTANYVAALPPTIVKKPMLVEYPPA